MSASRLILVLFAGLLGLGVIAGGCAYSGYKGVIAKDETVKAAWADVDVDLVRRSELIGNLVETTKGYAGHEKEVFTRIAEARNALAAATTPEERIKADNAISGLLRPILVQPFPELKANENFRTLMVSLEGTENRIAEKRRKYNDAVKELNTQVRAFPGSLYAGWAGVKEAAMFQAAEAAKEAPKVKF